VTVVVLVVKKPLFYLNEQIVKVNKFLVILEMGFRLRGERMCKREEEGS
jgi:hypothetical protein